VSIPEDKSATIPKRIAFIRNFIVQRFFPEVLKVKARKGQKPKSKYSWRKLEDVLGEKGAKHFLGMAGEKSHLVLNQLADFIEGFHKELKEELENKKESSKNSDGLNLQDCKKLLRTEDILLILQQFGQLSIEEKKKLGLIEESDGKVLKDWSGGQDEVLLQQSFINTKLYDQWRHHESSLNVYRASIGVDYVQEIYSQKPYGRDKVEEWINRAIKEVLQDIPDNLFNAIAKDFQQKVEQEIDEILLQSGVKEIYDLSPKPASKQLSIPDWEPYYIDRYLTPGYVQRLTQSVIENSLLAEDFPISISSISLEKIDSFPCLSTWDIFDAQRLAKTTNDSKKDHHFEMIGIFPPEAYQAIVHFKIIFDKGTEKESSVEFSLCSRGAGGTQSHVIKIINSMLFLGIPCLEDFFPIAHDVFINQEFIQYNISSPVWTHCFVKLCQNDVIAKAMLQSKTQNEILFYEQFASNNAIGRGDYCGFSTLDSAAKAALYARLRAIRSTTINITDYIEELKEKIEITELQRQAHSYVESYPFSSLAKISYLQENILKQKCDENKYQCIETLLEITETYLDEGSYQNAGRYLLTLSSDYKMSVFSQRMMDLFSSLLNGKNLEQVEDESQEQAHNDLLSNYISSSQIIRYEICRALYVYFHDPTVKDTEQSSIWQQLIPEESLKQRTKGDIAWKILDRACQHLSVRFSKYYVIHEVSQAVFSSHYYLLAKIFMLRSQLMVFFSKQISRKKYLPTDDAYRDTSKPRTPELTQTARLYLLEKTRIYACFDGDDVLYSIATAYQCWAYIMEYFHECGPGKLNSKKEAYIKTIKNLRDEALLSYANTGLKCYNQIKAKSGISEELNEKIGRYYISKIPPIMEYSDTNQKPGEHNDKLYLDMSLLSVRTKWIKTDNNQRFPNIIFMFGVKSSYLLFIRGLYLLCNDWRYSSPEDEFKKTKKDTSVSDLDKKFERAYHLLELAWATADDGGLLESFENNQFEFTRNFKVPAESESRRGGDGEIDSNSYYAASVRDLYPYRVTEIADFAKIFAAVCALLRFYTILDQGDRERIKQRHEKDINKLLNSLHRQKHCEYLKGKGEPFENQDIYNGCFREIFEACKKTLLESMQTAKTYSYSSQQKDHIAFVQERKNILLKKIFYTFSTTQ
jgi:hypothetical protein